MLYNYIEVVTIYYEEYFDFFAERLSKLRKTKGVSAKDMSLDIGQSEGYISQLERKAKMPSYQGILFICDYFRISPKDFFDIENKHPEMLNELLECAKQLDEEKLKTVTDLVKGLIKKS